LADTSFPPGFSPVRDTPVLDVLEGSVSDFSSCDEYMDASNEDMDVSNEGEDVRTVGFADKTKITEQVATSSKPAPWHFGSDERDFDKWKIQKNKRSQKPTYSETLKGYAPGPSAKPREPLNFVKKKKRNNIVRR
jgi:hypothetical protein